MGYKLLKVEDGWVCAPLNPDEYTMYLSAWGVSPFDALHEYLIVESMVSEEKNGN